MKSYLIVYGEEPIPTNLENLKNKLSEEAENQTERYFILHFRYYKNEIDDIRKEVINKL